MAQNWDRRSLLDLSSGFMKARIVLTAAELDIFSPMIDAAVTVEDLCHATGAGTRGLRILVDALAAIGLLERDTSGAYTVVESAKAFLAPESGSCILPILLHRARMWRTWSNLTEIVRTGENPWGVDIATKENRDIESFIGAMHAIGLETAHRVAQALDLSDRNRLLDVGGGSGVYTIAFLQRFRRMGATIFDLPEVVDIARDRIGEHGLQTRVDFVSGDFRTDLLPTGYDVVLFSAIIHMNSRPLNRALFAKAYQSLKSNGLVLVRDYVMDETRAVPTEGAIFAVNMLAATTEGNSYTFNEIQEDMERAGFRDVRLAVDGPDMSQVVAADK